MASSGVGDLSRLGSACHTDRVSTWGPGVFSDDTACDLRDAYRELVEQGGDDGAATDELIASFAEEMSDPEIGNNLWIALAVLQSQWGRLRDDVKARALAAIAKGPEEWWPDPKVRIRRAAALARAAAKLNGPQPPRKRVRPPWREVTSLRTGDVIGIERDGKWFLARVVKIEDTRYGVAPLFLALDFVGRKLPSPEVIEGIKDRPPSRIPCPPGEDGVPRYVLGAWHVGRARKSDPDFMDVGFRVVAHVRPRPGDDDLTLGGGSLWHGFVYTLPAMVRPRANRWYSRIRR